MKVIMDGLKEKDILVRVDFSKEDVQELMMNQFGKAKKGDCGNCDNCGNCSVCNCR